MLKRTLLPLFLLVCLLVPCLGLTSCGKDEYDDGFWLLTEDISKYITMNADDYRNAELTVKKSALNFDPLVEITDSDVLTYIRSKQIEAYTGKNETLNDGYVLNDDLVKIWYRGEVNMGTADEPNWVEFLGGSNYNDTAAYELRIGSGKFIEGFEDALVELFKAGEEGVNISETGIRVFTGTNNVVGEISSAKTNIVNISYKYTFTDKDGKLREGTMTDRVDLNKNDSGEYTGTSRYSKELRDSLFGLHVKDYVRGEDGKTRVFYEKFDLTQDLEAEDVKVTSVRVVGAVVEENVEMINVSFPANYTSTELAGKDARWFVAIDSITRPTELKPIDQLDYDFIEKTLGINYTMLLALPEKYSVLTADEIAEIGTESAKQKNAVVEHYQAYIKAAMEEDRQAQIDEAVQNAFWEYIIDKVVVNEWPEDLLEQYVEAVRQSAQAEFEEYLKSDSKLSSISTLAQFLVNYYNTDYFPNVESVEDGFRKMAEEQLKSEMALYYIAANEKLTMTKSERDKAAEEEMAYIINYYTYYYQQAGQLSAGESFTEADMANAGITRRSLIENMYLQRVNEYIAKQLADKYVLAD